MEEMPALAFSKSIADETDEGALYLQWQFDSAAPTDLEYPLLSLRENAHQAGVDVSFEAIGNEWLVKLVGLHEPMPAVLDALARNLNQPEVRLSPSSPVAMIAIRELLKAFPACCVGARSETAHAPASLANAHWQGLGVGLPAACEAAIRTAASHLPGQPATIERLPQTLTGQHLWHEVNTDSSEAALLLFCPTPTQSLIDEAAWRLLGHLLHGPFYQRLRVELQLGYAIFSGIRQINGQTGLLFGVQSPSVSLAGIVEHLKTFLQQLPSLIAGCADLGAQNLAEQFTILPVAQAGDLLWHAQLAGHPSDYLERLQQLIQTRTREDLLHAAQQLNDATGGWRCVANGPCIDHSWQPSG